MPKLKFVSFVQVMKSVAEDFAGDSYSLRPVSILCIISDHCGGATPTKAFPLILSKTIHLEVYFLRPGVCLFYTMSHSYKHKHFTATKIDGTLTAASFTYMHIGFQVGNALIHIQHSPRIKVTVQGINNQVPAANVDPLTNHESSSSCHRKQNTTKEVGSCRTMR
ncbi:hypothetical protein FF38_09697 [Lucilia cuprina]|uniref:Uncharacterized protein n=1 Tax=Lucilia cuprina TaxID=7375 RepID=A0A0L0C546_LUCCU|nr:hypothetical protein FF38_09697 [Lucilia cuprina]